jgi:acyl carrier protein
MEVDLTDEELREELLEIISKEGLVERDRLTDDATLESLGLASVDVVMLLMEIEERYNVYLPIDAELSGVRSLPELLNLLADKIRTAPAADAKARAAAYGMGSAATAPSVPTAPTQGAGEDEKPS